MMTTPAQNLSNRTMKPVILTKNFKIIRVHDLILKRWNNTDRKYFPHICNFQYRYFCMYMYVCFHR